MVRQELLGEQQTITNTTERDKIREESRDGGERTRKNEEKQEKKERQK